MGVGIKVSEGVGVIVDVTVNIIVGVITTASTGFLPIDWKIYRPAPNKIERITNRSKSRNAS